MAQMLTVVVNERQDDWDALLPHVKFAYNISVSAATGLAPNEAHMNRLPRLPLTVVEYPHARGHKSLARDQPEYVDLAADRQRRSYALVREQHALNITRVERRISALSDGLKQLPTYTVGCWVWVYNTAATIWQGANAGTDAKVLPFKILPVGTSPAEATPDGRPLAANHLYFDLLNDRPGADAPCRVSVVRCEPCANSHDSCDLPRFLPTGLTPYVFNNYTNKSPPYHVTEGDATVPIVRV